MFYNHFHKLFPRIKCCKTEFDHEIVTFVWKERGNFHVHSYFCTWYVEISSRESTWAKWVTGMWRLVMVPFSHPRVPGRVAKHQIKKSQSFSVYFKKIGWKVKEFGEILEFKSHSGPLLSQILRPTWGPFFESKRNTPSVGKKVVPFYSGFCSCWDELAQ